MTLSAGVADRVVPGGRDPDDSRRGHADEYGQVPFGFAATQEQRVTEAAQALGEVRV